MMKKVIKLLPRLIALGFIDDVDFKIISLDGYTDLEWLNESLPKPTVQELLETNDAIGVIYDLYTKVNELVPNPDCVFNEYDDYQDIVDKWKDARPIPSEAQITSLSNDLSIEKERANLRADSQASEEESVIMTEKVKNDLLLDRLNQGQISVLNSQVDGIRNNAAAKKDRIDNASDISELRSL